MRQISLPPSTKHSVLVVTAGTRVCAVPVDHVVETMRPLAIEPISGVPDFVRGVSVVRGEPVPVVDLNALLANREAGDAWGRFVIVRAGERRVALAVERVVGLHELDPLRMGALPPLLVDVGSDVLEAVGTHDAQLLVVLRAAHIVPEEVWTTIALRDGTARR